MNVQFLKPCAMLYEAGDGISAMRSIEQIGRVSHRSEDLQTEDSYKRFIPAVVLGHGDWSITEHVSATVAFSVDRGISHEIVRHRIASYTQESTRFVNYDKRNCMSFIMPLGAEKDKYLLQNLYAAATAYQLMLATGKSPQIARSVLPNALATRLIMTANLRSWRGFLIKRTTKETHPEMRRVIDPLLSEFQERYPYLYNDIIPGERQADAIKKGM